MAGGRAIDATQSAARSFGETLREHRLTAGLTQEELAARSGLSVRGVSDLERDRSAKPYLRTIRMLADALNLTDSQARGLADLARGRVASPGGGPAVPCQLPAGVAQFAGREHELKTLDEFLNQASKGGTVVISAIAGTAGIGKTALAVHWARRAASMFPDGQLYVNLGGYGPSTTPLAVSEVLSGFLTVLGVSLELRPPGLDAQAGLYRSIAAGKRLLIVLDNARDADQVRPLLPGSPGCLVLVTSRAQLGGLAVSEGAHLLTLGLLSENEARQLLAGRLGAGRVTAEPAAVSELIRLCARLPLALAIAAARASARPAFPLIDLAAELRDVDGRLDALDAGDPASSIRSVFSWSYQSLTGRAARLFRLLGLHPGPDTTVAAAASTAGVPQAAARQSLRELTQAQLLTEHSPGRYACHDLLRAYAQEQARATDSEADREATAGRMLDHYLHTAHAAACLLRPSRDPIALAPVRAGVTPEQLVGQHQAVAWFEAEHQVLRGVVTLAADAGFDGHAWQVPWAMADSLDWRGYWPDWTAIQRIAIAAAMRLDDTLAQTISRRLLAHACIRLGEYDQARFHLAACLERYQQTGNRVGQARTHQSLTLAYEQQGRPASALGHAEQALRLFQAIGCRAGQAEMLNAVGWCHAQLGDYQWAQSFCQQALILHREVGDRSREAYTWDSLGYAEHHLGHHARAVSCYQRALGIAKQLGDRYYQATMLLHLADTHAATGTLRQAQEAREQAVAILDDLHLPVPIRSPGSSADDQAADYRM